MTGTLSIRDRRLGGCHLVVLDGEIDLGSAPVLRSRLSATIALAEEPVLLDVSGVGFCDAAGLNVFAVAIKDAAARPVPLHLVGLRGRLANVFTLTGLDQALPAHPDLRRALRALRAGADGPHGAAVRPEDGRPVPG
ncbi:STAS domain-containing protein [Actinocorallia longicatena]|uniref:STAS domain-containing protein n=1 Tax=Actinocorallia longicatena TaxID=111803 RepID=UPI0031D12BAB